ncbi:hypothetical protein TSA6c_00610 [Azospirillum sp. TSA6c]|uniref:hypothetical protein n=1 Tax=Azospirillum sp. TSA6c TaxID=709813 RepID=UPI000D62230B|nr:hypothetical protein [Azospirillum sp. TSA6c]PWC54257.1 hypothetical protein TSA6c_00610 [Azospirillum sp. TSA6c]
MPNRTIEDRRARDIRLLELFERGLTNEEVGKEFGCATRSAGCHRARLLAGGKVPVPGFPHSNNSPVERDSGAYMAFVEENGVAGPEDAIIRVKHYRPLPATAISYARIGSATAMCAAIGERRAF